MFQYHKDEQNIVTLTLDMPDRSANVLNEDFGAGLEEALGKLEAEEELAGVIITSAKSTFIAGADIDFMFEITEPQDAFEMAESLKGGFRRLETMGKPVVAALNGTALGGGLEFALACHHRIALNNPKARFGFPEVTLGLIPGGGGVTRIVRMVGLEKAFPILTEGRRYGVQDALKKGLVNDVADSPEEMLEKAKAFIAANPASAQAWDQQKRFKIPGGGPSHPKIGQMLSIAPAVMKQKTYGNYPAAQAIMNAAVEGAQVDFDTAARIESRYFASVLLSPEARNMITAFWYQLNEINKGQSRPDGFERSKVTKVGMLGAGMMGAGIAYVSAKAGIEVVLKDVSIEGAEKGKGYSEKLLTKQVRRGRMTQAKADEVLARIHPTADAADFEGCDLVIEAVFENRELKAKVTKEAEAAMPESAVFASNTSTLPITGLAEASVRPDQFIGLHFFSPVDKMKLVEIIVGEKTSQETLAKAFDYVLQIRKTPIVVNDSRGFYTSRVFATYVMEGAVMLKEGQHPRMIEAAGLQAGMPVGPLALLDEVSLSLVWDIRVQTRKDMEAAGIPYNPHPGNSVLKEMVEKHGRKGKAAGAGFYEYPKGENKYLWTELREHYPLQGEALNLQEMKDRLLFIQAIESVRCLEEDVVTTVADVNLGSIFGWGFAPFKGGTLQFINDYGFPAFVERAQLLASKHGERFTPPQLLLDMAEGGKTFD